MKDIFNNNLIIGNNYLFYIDAGGFTHICYGIYRGVTKKGYACLEVTKRMYSIYGGELIEEKREFAKKVSVKSYKLIPDNGTISN